MDYGILINLLCGATGPLSTSRVAMQLVGRIAAELDMRWLTVVDDADLIALYRHARVPGCWLARLARPGRSAGAELKICSERGTMWYLERWSSDINQLERGAPT